MGSRCRPRAILGDLPGLADRPVPRDVGSVAEVQQSVQIGCLSNTNSMHWEHQTSLWPVLDRFDFRFLSFELGLAKPDQAIFARSPSDSHSVGTGFSTSTTLR